MKLPFELDLSGKTAVVTGAGGVLCSMFSKALAACGARVALLDLNLESAERFAREIKEAGGTARAYRADVLDRALMDEIAREVEAEFGPCDILLNGAGGNNPRANTTKDTFEPGDLEREVTTFFDLQPEGVKFVFDLNFLGTLIPVQSFGRAMTGRPGSVIVNVSSMNAFTPLTRIPAYSGAKAAVSNFTQWLAVHFAPAGIRVNAIAPGFFVTAQNQKLLFQDDGAPTERTEKILRATPMGRFGQAEELIGTLLYLVNPQASGFVTGTVIPVDGGFSAYSGV